MLNSINKVVRVLIWSNFFLSSGWGFVAPVFAIFLLENISKYDPEQAAQIAGFSFLIYWVSKSLLQIPISRYFDKQYGEKDDFWWMFFGIFITGLVPFGYLFVHLPWHVYAIELVHALGMAFLVPSWNAIFTRHIDHGKEAYEWAMDSTFLGLGAGITGGIGGILASFLGFRLIFVLAGILNIIACFLLLLIQKDIIPREHIHFPKFRLPFFHSPKQ